MKILLKQTLTLLIISSRLTLGDAGGTDYYKVTVSPVMVL